MMKKISKSILALLLAVVVIPFAAVTVLAEGGNISVIKGRTKELTGNESYGALTNNGTLTVKTGANVVIQTLTNNSTGKMVIEAGATVTVTGTFTNKSAGAVELYGVLRSGETPIASADGGQLAIIVQPGALFDMTFADAADANGFAENIPDATVSDKNRVYAHTHSYGADNKCFGCGVDRCKAEGHSYEDGKCAICDHVCDNTAHDGECPECGKKLTQTEETQIEGTASALSEGSLTVIVGIVCLAVGFLAAMFVFKKKPGQGNS